VRRHKSFLREIVEVLLIAVVFALFARTFVIQAFKIPSGSMEENLLVGDQILVNKFIYGPTMHPWERRLLPVREVRRGDVVVFKFPDDPRHDYIKRCVALPGDEIELVDKDLFIDGEAVDDSTYTWHTHPRTFSRSTYLQDEFRRRDNFGPYVVPPRGYFCLGDNRDNSRDSRVWRQTAVPRDHVKGRAVLIYWSLQPTAGAPPGALARLGSSLLDFPARTRWERTGRIVR
jgi:signal peptidase I